MTTGGFWPWAEFSTGSAAFLILRRIALQNIERFPLTPAHHAIGGTVAQLAARGSSRSAAREAAGSASQSENEMSRSKFLINVRLDAVEVLLAGLLLIVATTTVLLARNTQSELQTTNDVQSSRELQWFRETYGPHHYSEREEEC